MSKEKFSWVRTRIEWCMITIHQWRGGPYASNWVSVTVAYLSNPMSTRSRNAIAHQLIVNTWQYDITGTSRKSRQHRPFPARTSISVVPPYRLPPRVAPIHAEPADKKSTFPRSARHRRSDPATPNSPPSKKGTRNLNQTISTVRSVQA